MNAKCEDCRFGVGLTSGKQYPTVVSVVCHRFPPQVREDSMTRANGLFPILNPDDWCGEFVKGA